MMEEPLQDFYSGWVKGKKKQAMNRSKVSDFEPSAYVGLREHKYFLKSPFSISSRTIII